MPLPTKFHPTGVDCRSTPLACIDGRDWGAPPDDRRGWRPRNDSFVTFMQRTLTCPDCLQRHDARRHTGCLHVVGSGAFLVLTDADDLHNPGRSLCARKVSQLFGSTRYQLLSTPALGVRPTQHEQANGNLFLSWHDGKRQLWFTRNREATASDHNCTFFAKE